MTSPADMPVPTPTLLFVYGTLKQGFGNHHINAGTRVPGDYVTAQPHGVYIVGRPVAGAGRRAWPASAWPAVPCQRRRAGAHGRA
jgi:hypothetical protein